MTNSAETPQVFQSTQREGFIKGRRSSVTSAVERFESEGFDDSANFSFPERTFTIRFEAYDEVQVCFCCEYTIGISVDNQSCLTYPQDNNTHQ